MTYNVGIRREKYIKKNKFYHNSILKYLKSNIEVNSSILEIGCGTGFLLRSLTLNNCTGIDIDNKMISEAKKINLTGKPINFIYGNAENFNFNQKFDYIIISDSLAYIHDIQKLLSNLNKFMHDNSRLIINHHNFLWWPILKIGEFLRLKMPQKD